jgi:hypothetical protein
VNLVYKVVLLINTKGVADNRHLAMGRELYRTNEAACLYRPIANRFKNEGTAVLEVLVA